MERLRKRGKKGNREKERQTGWKKGRNTARKEGKGKETSLRKDKMIGKRKTDSKIIRKSNARGENGYCFPVIKKKERDTPGYFR